MGNGIQTFDGAGAVADESNPLVTSAKPAQPRGKVVPAFIDDFIGGALSASALRRHGRADAIVSARVHAKNRRALAEHGGSMKKSELYRLLDQNTKKSDMLIQSLVGMHVIVEDVIIGNTRYPDATLALANPEADLLVQTEEQRRSSMI